MVVWEVLWEGVEEEVAASVLQAGSAPALGERSTRMSVYLQGEVTSCSNCYGGYCGPVWANTKKNFQCRIVANDPKEHPQPLRHRSLSSQATAHTPQTTPFSA